jgi:hypothetical protein
VDDFTRSWFDLNFEVAFLEKRQSEFQDLFAAIMERRHPGDFQRVRPWGKEGDRKSDGYLKSERILFAVYAPNELKSRQAIKKINADFLGALPHWQEHFETWVFVHNSGQGLGPEVLKILLELDKSHPEIKITHWGKEEIRREVQMLGPVELESLFGFAPTRSEMLNLSIADIVPVIEHVSALPEPAAADIKPVPAGKIEHNMLSTHVAALLKVGMTRESLVRKYFRRQFDPTRRDKIANAFRTEYQRLKENLTPDVVFHQLQVFAGGASRSHPRHECGVLAVLAYFFGACDIFEDPEYADDSSN